MTAEAFRMPEGFGPSDYIEISEKEIWEKGGLLIVNKQNALIF